MVDLLTMTSPADDSPIVPACGVEEEDEEGDVEDGELPEEGEICEDEEDDHNTSTGEREESTMKEGGSNRRITPLAAAIPARYIDLDPKASAGGNATDAMLNSWVNGVKQKSRAATGANAGAELATPTSSSFDPNDEYYGYDTPPTRDLPPPVTSGAGDRDYRSVGAGDAIASVADKDYRFASGGAEPDSPDGNSPSRSAGRANEFGDLDYRNAGDLDERRRKRRLSSPTPPLDENGRRIRPEDKRARHFGSPPQGAIAPPPRRAIRGSRWGERNTICKFFREGYCRDGDHCAYSHDAMDSMRKPELCKYYQQGYCKKGLQCPMLHGEFPCKAFHKGECSKEQCPYSHTPLSNFTRPIFDQMIRDEELASRIHIPAVPTKRKVLLPGGPMMPPAAGGGASSGGGAFAPESRLATPFDNLPPVSSSPHSIGLLPPPTITVPQLATPMPAYPMQVQADMHAMPGYANAAVLPQLPYPLMPPPIPVHAQSPPQQHLHDHRWDTESKQSTMRREDGREDDAPKSFNINKMLEEITQKVKDDAMDEIEESPASPPMFSLEPSYGEAPTIPQIVRPPWRLAPCLIPHAPNTNLPAELIQNTITDVKLRNDPRIKKLLSSQFDAVSSMISSKAQQHSLVSAKEEPTPKVSDPRSRDPRKKAASTASGHSSTSSTTSVLSRAQQDEQIQQMVEMQLQMMNQMQTPSTTSAIAAVSHTSATPASQHALLPTPSAIYAPLPTMPLAPLTAPINGGGLPPLPMLGEMNMMQGELIEGWDSMTPSGGNWMPHLASALHPDSSTVPAFVGRSGSQVPSYVPPAVGHVSNPVLAAFNHASDDDDMRRAIMAEDEPLYDDYGGAASPGTTSLREKRRDNQYDSPLNRSSGAQASRYNQMPNVKVRKRASPP